VLTIYGSGAVNPNEATPQVLLARVCSILVDQSLCTTRSKRRSSSSSSRR